MSTLWQDVRYGLRMLRKSPGFTAIALVTLMIGIGANTIMFSAVNGLLLRPRVVRDPNQLVGCHQWAVRYATYTEVRDDNPVFSNLTGYHDREIGLRYAEHTERMMAFFVTDNYFATLGVAPMLGRSFLPDEDQLGAEPVAVLTYHAWQRYGGDPDILGKNILVDGWPCQIVGVMPKGFTGMSLTGPTLWLPLGFHYQILPATDRIKQRADKLPIHFRYPPIKLIGRLKPGLSLSAAQEALAPVMARADIKDHLPLYRLPRLFYQWGDDRTDLMLFSGFLLGPSALILLIACLNLANMYLVQGTSRQRELAIRLAVGSSCWRLMRQLLVESALLATLGGLGGLLLAFWGMRLLNVALASLRMPMGMNLSLETAFDLHVFAATVALVTIAALLSGLWPAFRLSQRCVTGDLKEARGVTRSSGRRRRFLPRGLSVAGQVALSIVLVMAASLFTHNAVKAAFATPGYSWDGKLLITLDFGGAHYSAVQGQQSHRRLVEQIAALPGVRTAGLSDQIPFGDTQRFSYVSPLGRELDDARALMRSGIGAGIHGIDANYFASVGLPLLQGRTFTSAEVMTGKSIVIVNEALARRLNPDGDVLGRLLGGSEEIVGVVPNVRQQMFKTDRGPQLYRPLGSDADVVYLNVRLADSARALEADLLRAIPARIHSLNPEVAVLSATRLADYHRQGFQMWILGMLAKLSVVCGIAALFLASLGIYGVKSHMVASRTPEIGIRMTLGATNRGILAMVLREGAIVTCVGLSFGMIAALAATRLVRSVLGNIDPIDPLSIAATIALLGAASLLAGYLPARRAAKIDPMEALRYE